MSQTVSRSLTVAAAARPGPGRLVQAWRRVASARQGWVMRRTLATMDERMLADIGISRAQASFLAERAVLGMLSDTLR